MTRRAAIVMLVPVVWAPPGVDPDAWRAALAEDLVDLLVTLSELEPALATAPEGRGVADAIAWPGMPVYEVPELTLVAVLGAAAADGFDQAALLAADAPDLPPLQVGKLLRPLTTRTVAAAPDLARPDGLLGAAFRLPAPEWLPDDMSMDTGSTAGLRAVSARRAEVGAAPGWRRIRDAASFGGLDPAVEGWEATRALLGG